MYMYIYIYTHDYIPNHHIQLSKSLCYRHRGDIVLDVTLFGLKRGQAPPLTPEELTAPADAEVTEWPGRDFRRRSLCPGHGKMVELRW